MRNSEVIVVGAGIAGLTSAAILSKQGLSVNLIESHTQAGGCAGTFKRKNYILDAEIYLPKANLISSEPWDYDDWYKNDMKKFFENEFDLNGVK